MNRFGLHLSRSKDPWFVHVQNRFLEEAFESADFIAEALVRAGVIQSCVQVGANDGIHNDFLHPLLTHYEISALLIEPQPGPASSLRELYADNERVAIVEMAVAETEGRITLWQVNESEQTNGIQVSALTSSSREHVRRFLCQKNIELPIVPITVEAAPIQNILKMNGFDHPDMIIVDTEGMDHVIIDQLDFESYPPVMIQFEACHMESANLERQRARLSAAGYRFVLTERDVIGIHCAVTRESSFN